MKMIQKGLFRVCVQPITTLNCCATCISWEIGFFFQHLFRIKYTVLCIDKMLTKEDQFEIKSEKGGQKKITESSHRTQIGIWQIQLCHDDTAPGMTCATNQPLVSRHQATWWRWVERCRGVHRQPEIGGWRKMGRGGNSWQWDRIQCWNSNIRLRAPRRKSSWTASRSSHTEAPLLLLLQVHQAILHLVLLHLHHLDAFPPQHWRSSLLLQPP